MLSLATFVLDAPMPAPGPAPITRYGSPSVGSTLMTRAPMSPRNVAASGVARWDGAAWQKEVAVDAPVEELGGGAALVLSSHDLPHIVFLHYKTRELKLAAIPTAAP